MAYEGYNQQDLRTSLLISQEEARTGTARSIPLPNGQRVTIAIPAGTQNGQEIRLDRQGIPNPNATGGALILTITVTHTGHQSNPANFSAQAEATPPPPPSPGTSGNVYYPTESQIPTYLNTPTPSYPSTMQSSPNFANPAPYTQYDPYQAQPQYPPAQPVTPTPVLPNLTLPSAPPSARPPARSNKTLFAIIGAVLLVLAAISGVLYGTVIVPNNLHAQETATAVAQVTGTARVYATATAQVTATAVAQMNATATVAAIPQADYDTATKGAANLDDHMGAPDANGWDTNQTSCAFADNAYHAKAPDNKYIYTCYAENTNFGNFAMQVHMKITQGDAGGFIFRTNTTSSDSYLFRIYQSDGAYNVIHTQHAAGSSTITLFNDTTSLFKTGLNQDNTLAVVARGSKMEFYVNGKYLTTVTDSSLDTGQIGLIADNLNSSSSEVVYSEIQVWRL